MLKKKMLIVSALYSTFNLVSGMAMAGDLPSGGVVKSGDIDISQTSESLKVLQKTDKGIIEWQDFSVGRDKSVHFQQPSKTSATLNRVTGDFTSQIAGQITATGQVFLVNPNGILITKDGAINTQGFVASTLDITDSDFNKGNYTFSQGNKTGLIENQGNIDVADGGFVALLGGAVKNTGIVNAHLGKIGFAGGEKIIISFGGNDFLRVEVPIKDLSTIKDTNGNPISNVLDINGTIKADGGMVQLTVATAAKLYRQGVSLGGYVQVNTAVRKNGVIKLNGGDVNLNKNAKIVADNGNVKITTDSLTSSGSVQASQGNIDVAVAGDATLHKGASFDVSGDKAGKITFTAGTRKVSRFKSKADFTADSTKGTGGYIDITANKGLVWLVSGNISAKGTTQGGRIRVGGAFQGGGYNAKTTQLDKKATDSFVNRWGDNSTLQSADDLKVENAVTINTTASAGYGGTVILWSDKATDNLGKIDARGVGQQGGSVEISGKQDLINAGLKQVHVNGGSLLLDPKNLTVTNTSAYKTTLESGANVTLRASNDITINASLDTTSDTGSSGYLSLIAGRSILINQDLKIKGGLKLVANNSNFTHADVKASERDTGDALITVATGKTLSGGDKDLTIKMLNGDSTLANNKRYAGRITIWKADGKRVSIVHLGTMGSGSSASDITILNGGKITSTATDLVAGDVGIELRANSFTNLSDANALTVNDTDGRYLVWSENPKDNIYGTAASKITNYDFAQFNKSYNAGGADFQQNTARTGTIKTGSGFIYSATIATTYTASGASKTKVYDGKNTAATASLTLTLKNTTNDVATVNGIKFKVGNAVSGNSNKYIDMKTTVNIGSIAGKYYNTALSSEQKNAGTNLNIKYSGHSATYTDGNNKPVYGIKTNIDPVTGASITKRTLTVSAKATNRQYTGDTDVTLTGHSITGWADGETQTYAQATAGSTMKAVSMRSTVGTHTVILLLTQLTSALKTNYTLVHDLTQTVTISKRKLTLKAADFNAITKTYDGNKTATVSLKSTGNKKGLSGIPTDASAAKISLTIQAGAFEYASTDANGNIKLKIKDIGKLKLGGRDVAQFELGLGNGDDSGLTGAITARTLDLNLADLEVEDRPYAAGNVKAPVKVSSGKTGFAAAAGNKGVVGSDDVKLTIANDAFKYASDTAGTNKQVKWADKNKVTLSGAKAANYTLDLSSYSNNANAGSLTGDVIDGTTLTITLTANAKDYDGNTTLTVANGGKGTISGWKADAATGAYRQWDNVFKTGKKTATAVANSKNAGKTVGVTFSGLELNDAYKTAGYVIQYAVKTVEIRKKTITLNKDDFTVTSRVYMGSANKDVSVALKTGSSETGLTDSEIVTSNGKKDTVKVKLASAFGVFEYADGNVGSNKKLKLKDHTKLTLDGADKDNYKFNVSWYKNGGNTDLEGTITKRQLFLKAADFVTVTKTYDGNTNATTAVVKLKPNVDGLQAVGAGKGVIGGDKVTFTITSDMFKFDKTDVSGANAASKLLVADNSKLNAGLDNTSKANYEFKYKANDDTGVSATITAKTITLNKDDFTVASKVYEGANLKSVTVTLKTGSGETGLTDSEIVSGDDVKVQLTASSGVFEYADGNAGTNKTLKLRSASDLKLAGADKDNYKFDVAWHKNGGDTVLKGTITKRELTLKTTDFAAVTKIYDGTGAATPTVVKLKTTGNNKGVKTKAEEGGSATKGVISGDNVTFTIRHDMFYFDSALVASASELKVYRATKLNDGLDTNSKKNYEFKYANDSDSGISATITKRELTLKAADFATVTKTYDGNTDAKTAVVKLKTGNNKTGLTARSGNNDNKGVIGSDNVTFTVADDMFTFDSKNVTASKLLITTTAKLNAGLGGTRAGNYEFKYANGADSGISATITAKTLTLKLADLEAADRQYTKDDTSVTVSVASSKTGLNTGVVGSDKVTLAIASGAFEYADDTKANNKPIKWKDKTRVTLGGDDKANYSLDLSSYTNGNTVPNLTGNIIDGIALTITAEVNNREYNGDTTLTIKGTPTITGGWKAGEKLSKTWNDVFKTGKQTVTAVAASKAVGTPAVTFSGLELNDAYKNAGYIIKYAKKTVTISKKVLTLNANDFELITKTYNTNKTVTSGMIKRKTMRSGLTGVVGNETVRPTFDSNTLGYESEDANNSIRIWIKKNPGLTGTHAGNYKFNYRVGAWTGLAASITKKTVTLKASDFNAITRTYDGGKTVAGSSVTLKTPGNQKGLNGVITNQRVTLSVKDGALVYASKNASGTIQLNVADKSKLELGGSDAKNYQFTYSANADSGLKGAITPRVLTLKAADFQAVTKVYDGGKVVKGVKLKTTGSPTGFNETAHASDSITLTVKDGALEYASKNIRDKNQQLKVKDNSKLELSGTGAGNYTFSYSANANSGLTGNITSRPLTVTADVNNRAYNGGTGGFTLKNAKISNYVMSEWGGGRAPTVSDLTTGTLRASVANKKAENGKKVTFTGLTVSRYIGDNYHIVYDTTKTVNITKKKITLNKADFTVIPRVYKGTNDKSVSVALKTGSGETGLTDSEIESPGGTKDTVKVKLDSRTDVFEYADGNADTNKKLNLKDHTKLTLDGADKDNYQFDVAWYKNGGTTVVEGTITKRELTLKLTDLEVADRPHTAGNVKAPVKVSSGKTGFGAATNTSGVVGNDDVKLNIADDAFKYASDAIGNNKQVKWHAKAKVTLSGNKASNYNLDLSGHTDNANAGSLAGNIIRGYALTITLSVADREYNGNTTLTVGNGGKGTISGWKAGETLTKTWAAAFKTGKDTATATATSKDVGQTVGVRFTGLELKKTYTDKGYFIQYAAKTVKITQKVLTLKAADFQAITKVYDGGTTVKGADVKLKTAANTTGFNQTIHTGDTVNLTVQDGAFVYASENANGTIRLNVADKDKLVLSGTGSGNYKFTYSANADSGLKGAITKKVLTVSATVASTRVYNKSKNVAVSNPTITGWISGETKTWAQSVQRGSLTAAVANENVGNAAKTVTFTLPTMQTTGDFANYRFVADTSKKITITKRELTLKMADFKAVTKVYDGTTNTTTAIVALTTTGNNKGVKTAAEETGNKGVVSGDNVTFTITSDMFKFDKKDASGTNRATKLLVADNSKLNAGLDRESAVNYEFKYDANDDTGKAATITKRELTLKMADFKAVTKVYDGNTNTTTAIVALTTTGNNKGVKTAAEETSGSNKGVVGSDNVTFTIAGDMFKFDKTDVSGANRATKLLVADNSKLNNGLDSTSKKNYEFKYSANADTGKAATITARTLELNLGDLEVKDRGRTAGDVKAPVKVSSGKTGFAAAAGNKGVVPNDDVKLNIANDAFKYASDAVGNNKQVLWAAKAKVTLSGAKARNYTLDLSTYSDNTNAGTLKGNIIAGITLTITANVNNREYNGGTALTINGTPTITGWKAGETLSKTYADMFTGDSTLVAHAASKNVGTHAVQFRGLTLKPAYNGYVLQFANKTVTISKKTLTVTATVASRPYDGGTTTTLSNPTISGWVSSDSDSIKTYAGAKASGTLVGTAASKNAGTPRVTFSGVTFKTTTGTYGNYNFVFDNTKTVTINKVNLTVTATVARRPYDGGRTTTLSNPTISGWVSSDDDSIKTYAGARASGTLVGTAASKDVGTPRVTLSGVTFKTTTGTYGNYNFVFDTTKTVTITKRDLTVTATVASRPYDGTTTTTLSNPTISGWVDSDAANIKTYAAARSTGTLVGTAASKNVGTPRVTLRGVTFKTTTGTYGNYNFVFDTTKTVTITKRTLTVTADVANRAYDGTTGNLTLSNASVSGWVADDTITKTLAAATQSGTLVGTAAVADAGTRAVTFDGLTLKTTGGYGNYQFAYATDKTVNINQKTLTLNTGEYTVNDKVYDDSTDATVSVASGNQKGLTGAVGDDNVRVQITDGAFVFATSTAGDNKQVNFGDVSKLRLIGTKSANYKFDTSIADGTDSGLKGTITQPIINDEAVNIFKNVMKTNPLTGSAIFSARQRAFIPPTPVVEEPIAPAPAADTSSEDTQSPVGESPVAEKSEAQEADNSRDSANEKSQDNTQSASENTEKTGEAKRTAKKRSSGSFVVSLRSDYISQLAQGYSEKIVNPDRDEDEGIVLILD